jgi:hypothetical protein
VFEVAVYTQIFFVASVLLEESTWLADALDVKDASQGRHIAFIIERDERIQLRSGLVSLEVLTPQLLLYHRIGELLQRFEYFMTCWKLQYLSIGFVIPRERRCPRPRRLRYILAKYTLRQLPTK